MGMLTMAPGVVRDATPAKSQRYWYESHLFRWVENVPRPILGWDELAMPVFQSRIKLVHRWRSLAGDELTAFLCEGHVWVLRNGVFTDVSPTDPMVLPFSPSMVFGGYGDGPYGEDAYGTPRAARGDIKVLAPVYSIDNWGEDLVVMTSADGRLLKWSPSAAAGVKLTRVTNSPRGTSFVVTGDRHVIVLSAGVYNRVAWCDQENIENWDFANVASKAGFLTVAPSGFPRTVIRVRNGILFFTETDAFLMTYIGLPYVYSMDHLGAVATPISGAAIQPFDEGAVWQTIDGFMRFDGASFIPLACPLQDWINQDISREWVAVEAGSMRLTGKGELWFFYPQSAQRYNSRAVIVNPTRGWWSMAQISRNCGVPETQRSLPLMCDGTKAYNHEVGQLYPGAETPWLESGTLTIGDRFAMTMKRIFMDINGKFTDIQVRLRTSFGRGVDGEPLARYTDPMTPDHMGYVFPMETGVDHRIRVGMAPDGSNDWSVGDLDVDVARRGKAYGYG